MISGTMACLDRNLQFPQQRHSTVERDRSYQRSDETVIVVHAVLGVARQSDHGIKSCRRDLRMVNRDKEEVEEIQKVEALLVWQNCHGVHASVAETTWGQHLWGRTKFLSEHVSWDQIMSDPSGLWVFQYAKQWRKTLLLLLLWKENVVVLRCKNAGKQKGWNPGIFVTIRAGENWQPLENSSMFYETTDCHCIQKNLQTLKTSAIVSNE